VIFVEHYLQKDNDWKRDHQLDGDIRQLMISTASAVNYCLFNDAKDNVGAGTTDVKVTLKSHQSHDQVAREWEAATSRLLSDLRQSYVSHSFSWTCIFLDCSQSYVFHSYC